MIEGAGLGATVIDCRVAELTVRVTPDDVTPFEEAVMLVLPGATPVAKPMELMVAKLALLEFHAAELVRFAVVPSE
jgi:hypothetical protein